MTHECVNVVKNFSVFQFGYLLCTEAGAKPTTQTHGFNIFNIILNKSNNDKGTVYSPDVYSSFITQNMEKHILVNCYSVHTGDVNSEEEHTVKLRHCICEH